MKPAYLLLIILLASGSMQCQAQNGKNMQQQNNPLLCDPETGICEIPGSTATSDSAGPVSNTEKPIKLVYFTDPICSSCWGIEPQLRKLKLEYGDSIEIDYRMGGLLPDWSYNSGGISKPSDVAHHWDEVSVYYDMPIDGNVWLEDPLPSSYPPSIAFKAAQMQDHRKAVAFLRVIREMVFLQKKNITRWEHLELAAQQVGLDAAQLKKDYEGGKAKTLFEEDLKLAREWSVRGFPTMFFTDAAGQRQVVYGSKPYGAYLDAIKQLLPALSPKLYNKEWTALFSTYPSLTAKEFSELMQIPRADAEQQLEKLTGDGQLNKRDTKNGSLWTFK
ncbi:ClpXP adapter SpxH family protein [Niabella hibiscisoli]|uniref:ClpXP adapter SpxH family protein n=1 Tax=Niabella hibiscisoli TaxID=1825928 RepID=UPI001F0E71FB|nr:ClpXP adapter SpxH family protein [Niabella hibiscisoli]MCH5718777.1 DsbA family protein [Niabella hibiscisoli]